MDALKAYDRAIERIDSARLVPHAPAGRVLPSSQPSLEDAANSLMADRDWPEPMPIATQIDPESYPLDALPDAVRLAVEEVTGFTKAPLPLVASSALSALSLAIQAQVDVKRTEGLVGPVGLFILTVADSGERKSTCDGYFTSAIRTYEAEQAQAGQAALADHRAAMEAWESKRSGIKEKLRQHAKDGKPTMDLEQALADQERDPPIPPRIPRLLYADITPEALAYNFATSWPSGGVVSSEAGIVLGSHGMGKDSVMRNLAQLNQLWDGNSLSVDRRTSESFTVRGARLTVALQIQEATLRSFFERSGALARGTGFLARFLVSWPASTQGYRPFSEPPATWPHLAMFNRRITEILNLPVPMDEQGVLTTAILCLTGQAKAAWVDFYNTIEVELRQGGELHDVRDVASKSADNAARLAALFQVFQEGGGPIGLNALEGGCRIAAWHLNEARRFFGEIALPRELADAGQLEAWLMGYCKKEQATSVPIAKVQQGGPSSLRSKAAIEAAMHVLEAAHRAYWRMEGKRKLIDVHPALLENGRPI